jgi:aminopeptidase N
MRYLHHPLRGDESAPLVRPALDLLPEIQRTGDIFFPRGWANVTLGGYQSAAVAADVRRFIDTLPVGYPPQLRSIVLVAADPLYRAAALSGS